uniref:6-phosphogluconolactonase n=1 Tax=Strigamia maritima TaxID=126957 RepID=T1JA20_STRMM
MDGRNNNPPVIVVRSSEKEVSQELCSLIESIADEATKECKFFKVGVSGGSLVKLLCNGIADINTDWSKWRIFFCDERIVPFDDNESTFGLYQKALSEKVPLTDEQIIPINPSLPVEDVATDYITKMHEYFKEESLPRFDLLLLGMGPDGHTCSLFPGHRVLKVIDTWIATVTDSPKPPPCRITLTFPVINNSRACVFVSTGEGKAETIKRVLEGNAVDPLPASLVRPTHGKLYWLLDEGAASLLNNK